MHDTWEPEAVENYQHLQRSVRWRTEADGMTTFPLRLPPHIAAMESAVELATSADPFDLDDLLSVHRTLMDNSPTPGLGGVVREEQNWIGGSSFNPCSAAFVPPPHEYLDDLLADLLAYVNGDDHSPLVQAAIAHAQFETLHPFADGNGRTGRALIHVVLRRRGLAPAFVPLISLVLATRSDATSTG
jgi:Fic family protein